MGERDAFERILRSFYDAMLDDALWPAAFALIDEACGLTGNGLLVVEGAKQDARLCPLGLYYRGEPCKDLERGIPGGLPSRRRTGATLPGVGDGRLVHVGDLYTGAELRTSRTYNEMLPRAGVRDGLNARLEVSDGCHIAWCIGDPVALRRPGSRGWIWRLGADLAPGRAVGPVAGSDRVRARPRAPEVRRTSTERAAKHAARPRPPRSRRAPAWSWSSAVVADCL